MEIKRLHSLFGVSNATITKYFNGEHDDNYMIRNLFEEATEDRTGKNGTHYIRFDLGDKELDFEVKNWMDRTGPYVSFNPIQYYRDDIYYKGYKSRTNLKTIVGNKFRIKRFVQFRNNYFAFFKDYVLELYRCSGSSEEYFNIIKNEDFMVHIGGSREKTTIY